LDALDSGSGPPGLLFGVRRTNGRSTVLVSMSSAGLCLPLAFRWRRFAPPNYPLHFEPKVLSDAFCSHVLIFHDMPAHVDKVRNGPLSQPRFIPCSQVAQCQQQPSFSWSWASTFRRAHPCFLPVLLLSIRASCSSCAGPWPAMVNSVHEMSSS